MKLRPCIDIHNGQVKQIVGGSLKDQNDLAKENFVSDRDAAFFASFYKEKGLTGGHIIILNAKDSPYYEASLNQAKSALKAQPGLLQIGGGINADNAGDFIDNGASHVIVTSYVFSGGIINYDNLKKLVAAVGKERIVLDLSCKKKGDDYFVATDRWQKLTDVILNEGTLGELSAYCDEFLIHAVDVEGKQSGIEKGVADILGKSCRIPVTYAGGVHSLEDIELLKKYGHGKVDVTVGSALSIFGGQLDIDEVINSCKG
ncbi:MAG: phosphoribosylformimino-5-aminoimidazole carboxamide ribotide isomerase [Butyrivibrio sp.]|nr:phosphoribosylformimino-5-aminoimidazole carboxamide ribotide isomerase [Butyrivibrio sp.]